MARNSDIRSFIITKAPLATISELHEGVKQLSVRIDALQSKYAINSNDPDGRTITCMFGDTNLRFQLCTDLSKFRSGDRGHEFSITGLDAFKSSLHVLDEIMGKGERIFGELVLPFYNDLMTITNQDRAMTSVIAGNIFTGLMKRYSNRQRSGSQNNYSFKVTLKGYPRAITFSVTDLSFRDDDTVGFVLKSNDDSINYWLNVNHCVSLPTPEVAARQLAKKMVSQWSEVGMEVPILDRITKHISRLTDGDDDTLFYERVICNALRELGLINSVRPELKLEASNIYFNGYSMRVYLVGDNRFGVLIRKAGVSYFVGDVGDIYKAYSEKRKPIPGQRELNYWTKRTHTSVIKWCKKIGFDKDQSIEILRKVVNHVNTSYKDIVMFDTEQQYHLDISLAKGYDLIDEDIINLSITHDGVLHKAMVPFSVKAIQSQALYILPPNEINPVVENVIKEEEPKIGLFRKVINKFFGANTSR